VLKTAFRVVLVVLFLVGFCIGRQIGLILAAAIFK
jgi:hypothetical protein